MFQRSHQSPASHRPHPLVWVALVAILVGAGYLRFTGLNWDEGQYIHPDEGHMRNTVSLISWPDDLSEYFDTHSSSLNVRNREGRRYSYGTLPLFVVRGAAEWLDRACTDSPAPLSRAVSATLIGSDVHGCRPGTFTGIYNAVVGRTVSAIADLATLLLIFLIGRRLYGRAVGLLAAGLGAVTAYMIQQAHYFTVDSTASFFVTAVAYFSVRASQAGRVGSDGAPGSRPTDGGGDAKPRVAWGDFALAGIAVGLAAACKVSAATAALLVVLAAGQVAARYLSSRGEGAVEEGAQSSGLASLWRPLLALCLAGLLSLVAFRVAQPYAFEGPGFFGVSPSAEWFERLHQIRMEQSGEVDLPSGRQWADRTPIVFPWVNTVVWGMGLPLGLAAWIAWAVAGFRLVSGRARGRKHLVLWGWVAVVFLYHGIQWVKSMRYVLHLYPILLVFAASGLVGLLRSAAAWKRRAGFALSGVVVLGAVFWGLAFFTIYLRPHPRLAASRWVYQNVPPGSTVANEHWDWGLPLRIDGYDPFGGLYTGIEMQNYDEDTADKRQRLYSWLDDADWIFLASNRLYASIPRLEARYPLTTEYYRALFAGELGFDLAADFTSYPALGPFVFPDQENPFALMEADYESQQKPVVVHLPPAEEAFSVYDHPRVLIFRKTEGYSSLEVRRILGAVELDTVQVGRTPRQATRAPDLLRFDREVWDQQRAGGTWSKLFNRDGLLNRLPGLAAVVWWLVVSTLGWVAYPLLFAALPRLRDRGYPFARVFALLIIAYLTWLAASLRLFPNSRSTIVRMVALLALAGLGVGWLRRAELASFVRRRWRDLLAVEALFGVLFAGWIGVRMLQPDLWHPVVGGEKPMDLAYFNAVVKSTWFPPYNPWLSGTWINYYYFGFVIVGTLTKLVGTAPSIAYNLIVPLIFGLTGIGAFSVAYNLVGTDRRSDDRRQPVVAGVAATVFTVLIGNLGVVHLVRNKLIAIGDVAFPSTIPGLPNTVSFVRGLWRVIVGGAGLAVRPESWYWHPTRIIPAEAGNPIAEFPAFTFLYGDLHAHMIAFPLTLLAVALAIAWGRGRKPGWGSLLIGGLAVGALRPTNTWDYPTYLLLGISALALGAWRFQSTSQTRAGEGGAGRMKRLGAFVRRVGWRVAVLVALSVALFMPYGRNYVAGYSSFEMWQGEGTPAEIYLWIHATLLFPVVSWLIAGVARRATHGSIPRTVALAVTGAVVLMGAALWVLKVQVALVALPILALAVVGFFVPTTANGEGPTTGGEAGPARRERLLWVMVAGAMALSLAVEILVLKGDIGRMNTVFKFYLQVWILLSAAAAVSLAWMWCRIRDWAPRHGPWWRGVMAALIAGSALFLPFGIRARAVDRIAPATGATLDGMAFMRRADVLDGPDGDLKAVPLMGDYHAIRWMQENIEGSPVILEGLGRREYLWANRVSIYTGLPTVVGWEWHQIQQRIGVGGNMVQWRRQDVNTFYDTDSTARAERTLERYGVRYVYVGPYERAYYDPTGLEKFERMTSEGTLEIVYDAYGVKIYQVVG